MGFFPDRRIDFLIIVRTHIRISVANRLAREFQITVWMVVCHGIRARETGETTRKVEERTRSVMSSSPATVPCARAQRNAWLVSAGRSCSSFVCFTRPFFLARVVEVRAARLYLRPGGAG